MSQTKTNYMDEPLPLAGTATMDRALDESLAGTALSTTLDESLAGTALSTTLDEPLAGTARTAVHLIRTIQTSTRNNKIKTQITDHKQRVLYIAAACAQALKKYWTKSRVAHTNRSGGVRWLFLGEAPPLHQDKITYLYHNIDDDPHYSGRFVTAATGLFGHQGTGQGGDKAAAVEVLFQNQCLLLDMMALPLDYQGVRNSMTYRYLLNDVHIRLRCIFKNLGLLANPKIRVMYVYNKIGQVASTCFHTHPLVLPTSGTESVVVNTHADGTNDRSAHGASNSGFPTRPSFKACAALSRADGKKQTGKKKRSINDFFSKTNTNTKRLKSSKPIPNDSSSSSSR